MNTSNAAVVIELPGEPRGKSRPRFNHITRTAYTPDATVKYERALATAGMVAMVGRPMIEGPVSVSVVAVFGVPASWSKKKAALALSGGLRHITKPDSDNVLKAIADGLNKIVWKDDAQITDLTMTKRYGASPGLRIEVHGA